MNVFISFFFLLSLTLSCSSEHELYQSNGVHYVKELKSEINSARIINWEVGRKKDKNVSKGIRFAVTVPKIQNKAKEKLLQTYGVDSWVFRIIKSHRGRNEVLAYYNYYFKNMSRTTKEFTLNVYYHAAAVSKQFRLFHCPAFNHRFEIQDLELEERSTRKPEALYTRINDNLRARVSQIRFSPLIVSAGQSLRGDYYLDFAFYNSSKKQIYSGWFPVDGKIKISQEIARTLPTCIGIKEENQPLPESRIPDIKDLEIK